MLNQSRTKMVERITLENGNLKAQVYKGQLVSLMKDGIEYMHGGGKPDDLKSPDDRVGWNKSEIFMYPVTGPVYDYKVQVGDLFFPQDQHGIARYRTFRVLSHDKTSIFLVQEYHGGKVPNPKHETNKESPGDIIWLPYNLEKSIELQGDSVKVMFGLTNNSDKVMPYRCGWHPDFKAPVSGKDGLFEYGRQTLSLEDVIEASKEKAGLPISGVDSIKFTDKITGRHIELSSEGFGNLNLWSPGAKYGQVCIEPVTQLPVLDGSQNYFTSGKFEQLEHSQKKTYSVTIKLG